MDLAEVGMTADVMSAFVRCKGWKGGEGGGGDCSASVLCALCFVFVVVLSFASSLPELVQGPSRSTNEGGCTWRNAKLYSALRG
jgi:hypothetical protein